MASPCSVLTLIGLEGMIADTVNASWPAAIDLTCSTALPMATSVEGGTKLHAESQFTRREKRPHRIHAVEHPR
jgi:hypothetical protein